MRVRELLECLRTLTSEDPAMLDWDFEICADDTLYRLTDHVDTVSLGAHEGALIVDAVPAEITSFAETFPEAAAES